MARSTRSVHIRKAEAKRSQILCGGNRLWKSQRIDSCAPSEVQGLLAAGGRERLIPLRKWGRKPARVKTVVDPVCGRCLVVWQCAAAAAAPTVAVAVAVAAAAPNAIPAVTPVPPVAVTVPTRQVYQILNTIPDPVVR